jgi:chain length determinant protein EpsF
MLFLTLIMTMATALAVSLLLPKSYKASATLVLNYRGTDPVTGLTLPAHLMPGYMATQVDIINSKNVALRVVDDLKLADQPALQEAFRKHVDNGSIREWIASQLGKKLSVTPSRESSVLDITYAGDDPQLAATIANAFARAYQRASVALSAEPALRASQYLGDQLKVMRANLEKAQNRLSIYQQEHGIVSADNRVDVETARLNDLSTQLVTVQGQLMDATSRSRQARGAAGAESPDVLANPLIQTLKGSLAQGEAKFAEIAQRVDRNHPQYRSAKAEVDKLRAELDAQVQAMSNSIAGSARILQRREAELRAAMAEQKEKVLELNRARDQLTVLMRDVDSAQHAYDATAQRYNQTSLEGQANQTDISLLNEATPPTLPSSPKILLNIAVSALLGGLLGVGLSMLAELLDRCVRSETDLAELLDVPVLASFRWEAPQPLAIKPAMNFQRLRAS